MIAVEICINSDSKQCINNSVGIAYSGGASRVELCSAMHVGGLTPQMDQIISARKAFKERAGLMVMIRPRAGNFIYSSREVHIMIEQIHLAAEAGADGIVFGTLKAEENRLDTDLLYKLMGISTQYNLSVSFHRAFDATPDPFKTIELLVEFGVHRVLTSGTRWGDKGTALDGIENLKRVIEISNGRIEIILGGGINSNNVKHILSNLTLPVNRISVHSYSGVQENGITNLHAIKSLINEVNKIHSND